MGAQPNFGKAHNEFVQLTVLPRRKWGSASKHIVIYYNWIHTPLAKMLVASVPEGICFLGCGEDKDIIFNDLQKRFPFADFKKGNMPAHQNVRKFFMKDWRTLDKISLCVRGTAFQADVWKALLHIPFGKVSTYGDIARKISRPRSARAVGTAVSQNPVAFVIPCHRVICSTGKLGGFYWGIDYKLKFLNFESGVGKKTPDYIEWEPTLF